MKQETVEFAVLSGQYRDDSITIRATAGDPVISVATVSGDYPGGVTSRMHMDIRQVEDVIQQLKNARSHALGMGYLGETHG